MLSGFEAAHQHMGNGMQHYGGYEDDFDMGPGAKTPELENEHPLSRQASAQAPSALMAMLATLKTQHECVERGHGDASQRSVLVDTRLGSSQASTAPMQQRNFGMGARGQEGDAPSTYDGGLVG